MSFEFFYGKNFIILTSIALIMAILGRFIIEIMGGPPEYIEKTLKEYISKLKNSGLEVLKEDYAPAEKPEGAQLWSAFVELEAKFTNIEMLLNFCFDAMPSSVEIIEPEFLNVGAKELTDFLNDLQARLHQSDMIIKTLKAQQKILDKNAITILRNFIRALLLESAKTKEQLSALIGVKPEELKPFLDRLIEEKKIVFENGVYSLLGG